MSSALTQPPARSVRLSHEEILRYSRHLILPEVGPEGQRWLKGALVALIGVGGLGSPAEFYLSGRSAISKERRSSHWQRCRPHSALSTDTRAS